MKTLRFHDIYGLSCGVPDVLTTMPTGKEKIYLETMKDIDDVRFRFWDCVLTNVGTKETEKIALQMHVK
jgi:hypothetical protein